MLKNRNIKISLVKGTSANIVGTSLLYDLLKEITSNDEMLLSAKELKTLYKTDYSKYKVKKEFQNGFIIGDFSYRNVDSCIEYFPCLGFDIDKVKEESEKHRIVNILKEWEYTFLIMPSVSGLGIRLMVFCDSTKDNHKEFYNQVSRKISKLIEIPLKSELKEAFKNLGYNGKKLNQQVEKNTHLDDSMNDISRFWFYSGLSRNEIYLNEKSKVYEFEEEAESNFEVKEEKVIEKTKNGNKYEYEFTSLEKVSYLVEKLEQCNIDITSGVTDWFKMGLSLANEFGEQGRSLFHRICRSHPDYEYKESDKEFSRCLSKQSKGSVTIGSFYSYCEDYGVSIDWKELINQHKHKFPENKTEKEKIKEKINNSDSFFYYEAERAIVGASLFDSDLLQKVYDHFPKFSNECFVDDKCRLIFKTIQSIYSSGLDVNIISVSSKLNDMTVEELTQYTRGNIFAEHLKTSVEIVYQAFLKRRLLLIATECTIDLSNSDYDIFDYADSMNSKINSLGDYGHSKNEDTAHSAAFKVAEQVTKLQEHYFQHGGGGVTGVPTGIKSEDDFTAGYQEQDLIILAARPGMGKTAKALQTLLSNAKSGIPMGFFSLEMSNVQLMKRLLSMDSKVDSVKLKKGGLNDEEVDRFNHSLHTVSNLPIYLDDTAGASCAYVLRQATKWKRKHGVKMIIVDYLQLMTDGGNYKGNKVQQITEISRQLKLIAKKLNMPVLALSQLSRAVESRGGTKRPQLSDLRESGAIEQDADTVSFIYRPEYYDILEDAEGNSLKGVAEIIYAKHRSGELGSVFCNWDGSTVRFFDSHEEEIESKVDGSIQKSNIESEVIKIENNQSKNYKQPEKEYDSNTINKSNRGNDEDIPF